LDTPPAQLALNIGPIQVSERHACVFHGRRFAHVVMQFQGRVVSLLITDEGRWLPSLTDGEGQLQLASEPVVDGFSVASFSTSHHRVLFVSDLGEPEVRRVAQALASSIAGQLAGA
jgi:hypothetical protein